MPILQTALVNMSNHTNSVSPVHHTHGCVASLWLCGLSLSKGQRSVPREAGMTTRSNIGEANFPEQSGPDPYGSILSMMSNGSTFPPAPKAHRRLRGIIRFTRGAETALSPPLVGRVPLGTRAPLVAKKVLEGNTDYPIPCSLWSTTPD